MSGVVRDVDRKGPRLLRLAPVEDDVRQCLIAGDLDAEAHPVATHWDRSRRLGADPDGGHWIESGVVDADLRREAIDAADDIWHPARAILSGFGRACERTDHVAVLSDARGVVARTLGGGDFADTARRLRLVEGALWDETTRGTNAIGTALAVGRPVSVEGGAHFARVNGELICLATPLRAPHGRVVAVLDATSRVERLGALPPEVILTVARAIEEVLRARVYAGAAALALVERVLEHAADAAFLVERPGRVVRANHAGRQLLAGRRTDEVLPTFEELAGAIESGPLERQEVDLGGARGRGTVEPVADAAGDVLALMDHVKVDKAVLCGLSVGGLIVQEVVRTAPERVSGLILCCTGSKIGNDEMWNSRIAAVEEGGIAALADAVMERWFSPAYRAAGSATLMGARLMLVRQPDAGYAAISRMLRDTDLRDAAASIAVPTL